MKMKTLEQLVVALLAHKVREMRQSGISDREIARQLGLPRGVIRVLL